MIKQQWDQATGPNVRRRCRSSDLAYHFPRQFGAQLHRLVIAGDSRKNEMILHALTNLYMPGDKVASPGMTKHTARRGRAVCAAAHGASQTIARC